MADWKESRKDEVSRSSSLAAFPGYHKQKSRLKRSAGWLSTQDLQDSWDSFTVALRLLAGRSSPGSASRKEKVPPAEMLRSVGFSHSRT